MLEFNVVRIGPIKLLDFVLQYLKARDNLFAAGIIVQIEDKLTHYYASGHR